MKFKINYFNLKRKIIGGYNSLASFNDAQSAQYFRWKNNRVRDEMKLEDLYFEIYDYSIERFEKESDQNIKNEIIEEFHKRYSMLIPDVDSINEIKNFIKKPVDSGVVETTQQEATQQKTTQQKTTLDILQIGSHLGLWAYLLKLNKITVIPTDENTIISDNSLLYKHSSHWVDSIEKLSYEEALRDYDDGNKVLMILSPPVDLDKISLTKFRGDKLIYIGNEITSGNIFTELQDNWNLPKEIEIPNFPEMNYKLFLYEKN